MMCLGMFMAILDVQVVATSIPTIQAALAVEPERISYVQTAYLIAEVIAIPLTGFLTRVLTMRWLFVSTLALFTIASVGCAASPNFSILIAWRVLQGLSGGTLIPAVFSAVFLLFPDRQQGLATTIGGVLAVLAPTIGPIVGGWITETWSWHWLFLINVAPGLVAVLVASRLLPAETPAIEQARKLDLVALALMATALAALILGLKEAPQRGWLSAPVAGLMTLSATALASFLVRTLKSRSPIVNLRTAADPGFAVGCVLSFALGIGLFGSVYMMPVFLAVTHGYGALTIGTIMLVTGIAQLATAPLAVALERRMDARLLSALGFLAFAIGLGASAFQTPETDYAGMFWPQVLRGAAIMFCLLPPTRMALGHLAPQAVPDASGLFNLMRNLGGAIGLALIDTVIFSRAPVHAAGLLERLRDGDAATARALGLPPEIIAAGGIGALGDEMKLMLQPTIERLAFVDAMNEAWGLVALITLAAIASLAFARPPAR